MIPCGEQIRAARALLGWTQAELALRAGIGEMTVKRFELRRSSENGNLRSLAALRRTLEEAGIEFIDADETGGIGVRLNKIS